MFVDVYAYHPDDITCLIDDDHPEQFQPTLNNIVRIQRYLRVFSVMAPCLSPISFLVSTTSSKTHNQETAFSSTVGYHALIYRSAYMLTKS